MISQISLFKQIRSESIPVDPSLSEISGIFWIWIQDMKILDVYRINAENAQKIINYGQNRIPDKNCPENYIWKFSIACRLQISKYFLGKLLYIGQKPHFGIWFFFLESFLDPIVRNKKYVLNKLLIIFRPT